MLRSLIHYWRLNLAVLLGAAVASTVLTGALLVGDSMRGSLRALALDRLGRIDLVVLSERFLREDLADELTARRRSAAGRPRSRADGGAPNDNVSDDSPPRDSAPRDSAPNDRAPGERNPGKSAPIILLRGAATHAGTKARASRVGILGIDGRFAALYAEPDTGGIEERRIARRPGQIFPSLLINRALQKELGAEVGDQVLLSFPRAAGVPRATLVGRRDPVDVLGTLRCSITGVVPDEGSGRFGLSPHQTQPLNAFVSLTDLQRALDVDRSVNAFLVPLAENGAATEPGEIYRKEFASALTLDDRGLSLRRKQHFVQIESDAFLLRDDTIAAVEAAAADLGAPLQRVQTYLANRIAIGDRSIPYSMLTALDASGVEPFPALLDRDGSPAPLPGDDDILLNSWAAEALEARPGDRVELTYFTVDERDELHEETAALRLSGVVAIQGLGADRTLTPHYPGIENARSMAAWDPPFPVDLGRIARRDEDYWDRYATLPKGFVSPAAARRMWHNRFGSVTALRVGVPRGSDADRLAARLEETLPAGLDPAATGIRIVPARSQGLHAAAGATDFSGLFFGFSMFLIASAALLAGLLFRLGVEQRAAEIGTLLAVGYPVGVVRRRFLAEGGLLAIGGALAGVAGGLGYAWLMMAGLRTLWLPAVGSPLLFLHVGPWSMVLGGLASIAVVIGSIASTVRQLGRVPPARLLAGSMRGAERPHQRARVARMLAFGSLAMAAALVAVAALTGATSSAGLAFGTGTSLLISGLAFFALWCRRPYRAAARLAGRGTIAAMAARNSAWNPGRSLLCVSLIGCASFVIVAVAAQSWAPSDEAGGRDSAGGGYTLVAETDVPLHQDLNRSAGRSELGFPGSAEAILNDATVVPFRLLPGDDASCLNLYRPGQPRILGVTPAQIARGGFPFQQTIDRADDPWTLLDSEIAPGVIPAFGDANSVRWILHLGLGKDLVLRDERAQEVRLRFVGLLGNSIFQSEVLISEKRFLELFPSRSGYNYFLIDAAPAARHEVGRHLEETLRPFGFDATPVEEKLAGYHAVQNTYLSTFRMLGGLGLLLGTLGLGVVLVRNVIERRGELATLRAFGYRRSRLAAMVLAENAFLMLLGVGLGTGAALVAVAPHLIVAGERFPWLSVLGTVAAVIPIGMLSSLAAVRGTMRAPLLPALKAER